MNQWQCIFIFENIIRKPINYSLQGAQMIEVVNVEEASRVDREASMMDHEAEAKEPTTEDELLK